MSDSTYRLIALLIGQGVLLTGIVLTYLSTRQTKRKVSDVDGKVEVAAIEAKKAVAAVEPISNGFAGHTTEALGAIQESVGELRGLLLGHIADHASSDVRRH